MLDKYLNELKDELNKKGIYQTDDIINYFEEMINDRIEIGEKLEDILEMLGEPSKLARNIEIDNGESKPVEIKNKNSKYEFKGIEEIDIDCVSYSFDILPSQDNIVHINFDEDEYSSLNIEQSGNTLEIEQAFNEFRIGKNILVSLGGIKSKSYNAKLYIPNNIELEIEEVSGNISIKDLLLDNTEISCVSGNINIYNTSFEELEIDDVSGLINMNNVKVDEALEVDIVSGCFTGESIECEEIEIESVSGMIKININGNREDTEIEISKLLSEEHYNSDGSNFLKLTTVSGTINYSFNN